MRAIFRTAHGAAAEGGALLAAEGPVLDETPPPNAALTATGLALRKARGRPFQVGNTAASGRGPSLTRVPHAAEAPDATAALEERRRIERKATSLKNRRGRQMAVTYGGPLGDDVLTELTLWSLAVAWSHHFYSVGDAKQGASLAEKSSAHLLKATGYAQRGAETRAATPAPWWSAAVEEEEPEAADEKTSTEFRGGLSRTEPEPDEPTTEGDPT